MCIVYRLLYHIAHIVHIARTPGLPCKTHIAHIVHIAWTRGRVEVQRVGGHIAHIAHIAWTRGRVEVQRVGGHIAARRPTARLWARRPHERAWQGWQGCSVRACQSGNGPRDLYGMRSVGLLPGLCPQKAGPGCVANYWPLYNAPKLSAMEIALSDPNFRFSRTESLTQCLFIYTHFDSYGEGKLFFQCLY